MLKSQKPVDVGQPAVVNQYGGANRREQARDKIVIGLRFAYSFA